LPMTLAGPVAPHGEVKVSRLTSAHITDNNESAQTVGISHETLSAFNPDAPFSLPPFSMTVLSWEAVGTGTSGTHAATSHGKS